MKDDFPKKFGEFFGAACALIVLAVLMALAVRLINWIIG